jgi:hypothetical protein
LQVWSPEFKSQSHQNKKKEGWDEFDQGIL